MDCFINGLLEMVCSIQQVRFVGMEEGDLMRDEQDPEDLGRYGKMMKE